MIGGGSWPQHSPQDKEAALQHSQLTGPCEPKTLAIPQGQQQAWRGGRHRAAGQDRGHGLQGETSMVQVADMARRESKEHREECNKGIAVLSVFVTQLRPLNIWRSKGKERRRGAFWWLS